MNDTLTDERRAELDEMLFNMDLVASHFYRQAVRIGNHAFIEFTGLMNEYIKICARMRKAEIDFALASGHTGTPLIVEPHEINYINEKLECIFVGLATIKPSE